jgi:hypothetical protein
MTALGDSLWDQYGGGNVPVDPAAFARSAIQRYGSGRAAGRALGVDEAQIRRWRDGKATKPIKLPQAREHARADQAAKHTGPVKVEFRQGGRDRTVEFGPGARQDLAPGTKAAIGEAYAKGDREAMAAALVSGIVDERFYGPQLRKAYRIERQEEDDGMRGPENRGEGSDAPAVFR